MSSTYHIQGSIGSMGGYEKLIVNSSLHKSSKSLDIFVFPSKLTSLTRNNKIQKIIEFTAKMFKINSDNIEAISQILHTCLSAIPGDNTKTNINFNKSTMTDSKITNPPKIFVDRDKSCLGPTHPGPVMPVLKVGEAHTPEATMTAQYYLGLSNEKFRWVRTFGGDKWCSEEKRSEKFNSILGNSGKGWIHTKKYEFKKKKTGKKSAKENTEDDEDPPVIKARSTRVEGEDVKPWMEHYIKNLIESNQFIDLSTQPNCPPNLKDTVLWDVGIDAGAGSTKLAMHTINTKKSNTGSKCPLLNLVNISDKNVNNWQFNELFEASLKPLADPGLSNLEIKIETR